MRRSRRRIHFALAAVWTALIAVGLFFPGRLIQEPDPTLTTLAHAIFFAGFVALWSRAAPRLLVAVVIAAVFLAAGTEALQSEIVPGRGAQTQDLWADLAGIVVGWRPRRRPAPVAVARRPAPPRPAGGYGLPPNRRSVRSTGRR